MSQETIQTHKDKEIETYDFNLIRLLDQDAIRIKEEKIPKGSESRKVHNVMGNVNRRKQRKHAYFSARA